MVNGGGEEALMGKGNLGMGIRGENVGNGSEGIRGGNVGNGAEGVGRDDGTPGKSMDGISGGNGGKEGIGEVDVKSGMPGMCKRRRATVVWRLPEKIRVTRRERMMVVVEAMWGSWNEIVEGMVFSDSG